MGTFGTSIAQDDAVRDVIEFVVDRLKTGASLIEASAAARARFHELEQSADEAPLLWLALASVQWRFGRVDDTVLGRVRADIEGGRGLERWRDDPRLLSQRTIVLATFLAQVEAPNPKPSPVPRLVVRAAPYRPGQCLAVRTSDGRHTAALVLGADNSNPEHGTNLIAGLDYLEREAPSIAVFEQRCWLFKHHGAWRGEPDLCSYLSVGFQRERKRITVVGDVALRASDPTAARVVSGWRGLGEQILLCRAAPEVSG
jgi:hypothetical protein